MNGRSSFTSYAPVLTSEPLTTDASSSTHHHHQPEGYPYAYNALYPPSQSGMAPSSSPSPSTSQTTFVNLDYTDIPLKSTTTNDRLSSFSQYEPTIIATPPPSTSYRPSPSRWWSSDSSYPPPPNLKQFSAAWWRYQWRIQVNRRRLPRLLYSLTGIVLLIFWVGISAAFAHNIESSEAINSHLKANQSFRGILSGGLMLFLQGQLNSFDPQARKLNVDWSAKVIQGPIMNSDLSSVVQVPADSYNTTIAIFRDTVAREDTSINSTNLGYTPYRLRNPTISPIGYLGISDFDSINTDISVGQEGRNIWTQPEFGYPFDIFKGTITFVAADNDTITALNRPGAAVLTLEGAILTDDLLNIKIETSVNATCWEESREGCELIIDMRAGRTGLVKFCVVAVFIINWAVTISIFLVTGEALLLHRTDILEGTDILAVCFTALFALPTVRSLLPGAPGYGCLIDLFGILPNVIIVTLCTAFFANSRLRMRARRKEVAVAAAVAAAVVAEASKAV